MKTPSKSFSPASRSQAQARAAKTRRDRDDAARRENAARQLEPGAYIRRVLGWTPWAGQQRILDDVARSYLAQFERQGFERGDLTSEDLHARARARFEEEAAAYALATDAPDTHGAGPAEAPAHRPRDMDEAGAFRPVWLPGDPPPPAIFRVESGHGFGKTKLVSGILNHAFDTFPTMAAVVYGTDWPALRDKTMRELFADREGKGLPGRVLEGNLRVQLSNNHFIQARATTDAKGKGKDRLQGAHPPFWIYAVDEADAVESFVFDAIDANATGGIGIVLLIGNPRRRSSRFARLKGREGVLSYRFSTHEHPNVRAGREVIPNAVGREWVRRMVREHCQVVAAPKDSANRFRLPWYTVPGPVASDGSTAEVVPWLEPDDEYRYMVLGVPPLGQMENTYVAPGVFDAAMERGQGLPHGSTRYGFDGFTHADDVGDLWAARDGDMEHPGRLTLGVDVARWGKDKATVYAHFRRRVWRVASLSLSNTAALLSAVDAAVATCREIGARPFVHLVGDDGSERPTPVPLTSAVCRVDNTGGGGSGVVDSFAAPDESSPRHGLRLEAVEVVFGSAAHGDDVAGENDARRVYADLVTQLYAFAAEAVKGLRLGGAGFRVPARLEEELTDRRFRKEKRKGVERSKLEDKDTFKGRHEGVSPDDADGFVLAVAHDGALDGCRRATGGTGAAAGGLA